MMQRDLDDLTLLLIGDDDAPEAWLNVWANSYPSVAMAHVSQANAATWYETVQAAFDATNSVHVMLVAHGLGANAALAWHFASGMMAHRRLVGAILLAPHQAACTLDMMRVRWSCRTAVCASERDAIHCPSDWARMQAMQWHARFLPLSQTVDTQRRHDWQWGMKLMQEIVLAD